MIAINQKTEAVVKRANLSYKLADLNNVVVQTVVTKGNHKYVLQRLHNNSVIYRSLKNDNKTIKFSYLSKLILDNFGHTQTLININKNNWLVGCNPKRYGNFNWATSLVEVPYPQKQHAQVTIKNILIPL